MRLAAMSVPGARIAVLVLLMSAVIYISPMTGAMPLMVGLTLIGPGALFMWCGVTRPVATLVGAYALLAPADALLLIGGGATLTRFLAFLALFGLIIAVLRDRSSVPIPRFAMVWFLALTWMIASVLWATDQAMALQKIEQIGLAVIVFELTALVPASRLDLRVIVSAVVASSSAIAVYAIVAHPVEAQLGAGRVVLKTSTGRADPNDLAAAMILAFALCIAATTSNDRVPYRIAGALLSLLLFVAILATGSRGGLLAGLLVVLWTAIQARRRIFGAVFAAAVTALSFTTGDDVWQRFIGDSTGAGRSDIWKVGVAAFKQHWFIGSGIGTFPDAYNSVYLSVPHHFYINWSRPAHDLIVQSFTELGIVGGILVLTAWGFQFRALASIRRDDPDRWLRVGLEAATLGYFVAALFIDVLDIKQTWVIPIVIAVVCNIRGRETAPIPEAGALPQPA